jgi:hypothetical protein
MPEDIRERSTGLFFTLVGSGGIGLYDVYLDEELITSQIFDIGMSQVFNVSLEGGLTFMENVPALCLNSNCSLCPVCPENMVVGPDNVDVGGFMDISCLGLSDLGDKRGLNPDFCGLYPKDIDSLCGCCCVDCTANQVLLQLEIELDEHPEDIVCIVFDEEGSIVWKRDFENCDSKDDAKATFESCVPLEGPLLFTINDKQQNGLLCCNTDSAFFLPDGARGYDVYLGGELVGSRIFPMGSLQELDLRDGDESGPGVHIDQPNVWCAACNLCVLCPEGGDFKRDEFIAFKAYGMVNCYDYFVNM